MVFCKDCVHHKLGDSVNKDAWDNQLCRKTKEETTEYVYGKTTINYKACRDINEDGNCPNFEDHYHHILYLLQK